MKRIFVTAQQKITVYPNYWDVLALLLIMSFILLFVYAANQMTAPYHVGEVIPIHLTIHYLPSYALATIVRMMVGMVVSLLFTFIIGTWAAKSRYAERILIPLIDMLQSVPVLGFLSITIVGFIALFPGSLLGPECAAIFAIFTAQAWNMTLGFYQSLKTVPASLIEAGNLFQLSAWQRFWRIEVPFSMPSLLWNMMLSMSASWFFVVASEAITVSNQYILLPGIGSYIAQAIIDMNVHAIIAAIVTMIVVIFLYDQCIFRPLVAWGEKFKADETATETPAYSWMVDMLQRTRVVMKIGAWFGRLADAWVNIAWFRKRIHVFPDEPRYPRVHRYLTVVLNVLLLLVVAGIVWALAAFVFQHVSQHEVLWVMVLGIFTGTRIVILLLLVSLVWVPLGVWIGLRPRVTQAIQPIVQFLASFPANLLFPVVVWLILRWQLNINIWITPLMMLGAQWYVLFNVIAGTIAIPKELLQAADNLGVKRWLRFRRVIFPSIFPYYITGAITAVGAAWNSSIVAEVVSWGHHSLVATGLGAYIATYTRDGDFPRIALGIGVMCLYVLLLNRLVWRPFYRFAESRYRLS